jgi:hypothetical protein
MVKRKATSHRTKFALVKGGGILGTVVNKAIDLLPVELHIPGYNYCGPGTKLQKRLERGDRGINKLDDACKIHDIAYSKFKDTEHRRQADKELTERAWQRFKAPDASLSEKAAAWAVTTAMKTKTKFGGGKGRRKCVKRKKPTKGRGLYLRPYPKRGAGKKKKRSTKKKHGSR